MITRKAFQHVCTIPDGWEVKFWFEGGTSALAVAMHPEHLPRMAYLNSDNVHYFNRWEELRASHPLITGKDY